jgi:hypothetical protein
MRVRVDNGGLRVNAVAGNHAVFLGLDVTDEVRSGCLGFAIHREDLTVAGSKWLSGFKTLVSTPCTTPAVW